MDQDTLKAGALLTGIFLTAIGGLGILALSRDARITGRHNWALVFGAALMGTCGLLLIIHVLRN
ncbi:MAG: hypothetical protein Q8O19_05115 [Rectinemataceae bacterium]|nr:hypothetical protein [Rectinemataceae bacterium]